MSTRQTWPRSLRLLQWALCLVLVASPARSDLVLPDNQGDRDDYLKELKKICRDCDIDAVRRDDGKWHVTVKDRTPPPAPPVTPKGCKLIKDLANSDKTIKLLTEPNLDGGRTAPDPPGTKPPTGARCYVDLAQTDKTYYGWSNGEGSAHVPLPKTSNVAHELIHGSHLADGTLDKDDPEGQAIDSASPGGVGVTENDIRHEQNAADKKNPPDGDRHGHCGGRN